MCSGCTLRPYKFICSHLHYHSVADWASVSFEGGAPANHTSFPQPQLSCPQSPYVTGNRIHLEYLGWRNVEAEIEDHVAIVVFYALSVFVHA